MSTIFIYIFYYIISIITLCVCYYFCRFTENDYKYNNRLKWIRRLTIIWTYLIAAFQISVFSDRKIIYHQTNNYFVLYSAVFFLIAYIFALGWVEIIKKHPNNKKKFK